MLDKIAFAQVALIKKDGTPHVTPMWYNTSQTDFDNDIFFINTATGRVKGGIHEGDILAISILDPDTPYRYLGIQAKVIHRVKGTEANEHIDDLAYKYQGKAKYPYHRKGEYRIKLTLKVLSVYS